MKIFSPRSDSACVFIYGLATLDVAIKNSLADGKNMPFVETVLERETTMLRGAKRDALPGRRSVGHVARVSFDGAVAH